MSAIAHKVNLGKMGVEEPTVSLTKEEYEAKYGKIVEEPEEEVEEIIYDLNQLQTLVRKTLVKLLQKPGLAKAYLIAVREDAGIGDDPDTTAIVKEEIEQSLSEMISMFRKKYKVK